MRHFAAPDPRVPDRHVVLTFDDGPTKWTAKILDVRERLRVEATFFVIGARVADRPDLLKRMYDDGDEVGVHTFTQEMVVSGAFGGPVALLDRSEGQAGAHGH